MMAPVISRRQILKVSAAAGTGLVLGACAPARMLGAGHDQPDNLQKQGALEPNVFVGVDAQGTVTVTISKSDMGQGVRTSLAMIAAEEMDADWAKVKVVQAKADAKYRGQGTGGSSSIRSMYRPLRQAGATARAMLVSAAAKKWGVAESDCRTEAGFVISGTHKASFGELAVDASRLPVPDTNGLTLKDRSGFKTVGKATRRVDNTDVVTGKATYGLDVQLPGMLYAVVAKPRYFGADLKSADEAAAAKVPGVKKVARMGSSVAVIAENTWAALQGREALNAQWTAGSLNSDKIRADLIAAIGPHGDAPAGARVVEAQYELPLLAHATMEPMNCVAHVKGDTVEVWCGTQVPESAQQAAARGAGVANAIVNVTILGGGFGRRLNPDYVGEAARIASMVDAPVKLLWTRDDDMKHDVYRPCTVHSFKGAVADGKAVFWSHLLSSEGGNGTTRSGRGAGIPYSIEGATMGQGGASHGIPLGAWRSVENTYMGFVNESFIDELAHAAGVDPLAFRLAHVRNERLRKCLEVAAEKAGWGKPMPKGSGRGIACFAGYGSFIAQVVEVTVTNGNIKVNRVVAAVDCGLAINPLGVEAQVQGASTDGLSTALKAAITIEDGGVAQSTFADYEWLTMAEAPPVEVHIIDSGNEPGGMGEVGYPATSAALANALFAATGRRFRKLPIGMKV